MQITEAELSREYRYKIRAGLLVVLVITIIGIMFDLMFASMVKAKYRNSQPVNFRMPVHSN